MSNAAILLLLHVAWLWLIARIPDFDTEKPLSVAAWVTWCLLGLVVIPFYFWALPLA